MNADPSRTDLPPEVEAWLEEKGPEERRSLEEAWRLAGVASPALSERDHDRKGDVWRIVSVSMTESTASDPRRTRVHRVRSSWTWSAAAVVAVLVGIVYVLRPVTIHAPHAEFAEATLPDGSKVHLNSGSTLTYDAYFVGARRVELRGQAYFEVVEGDDPFVVETFNARTAVLGTEFDVRARSDDVSPRTSVVVISGRVAVSSKGGDREPVIVAAGEGSTVAASGDPSEPVEILVQREIAWRIGDLAFNDQPFSEIFAELERRFDIEIQAPADLLGKRFSLYKHDPASAELVLSDLSQAEGLRFRKTANGFEIYRP